MNATLGTAGVVLGLGRVAPRRRHPRRRPAPQAPPDLLATGWSYSLLVLLGAVVAVIAMERALDHPRLLA